MRSLMNICALLYNVLLRQKKYIKKTLRGPGPKAGSMTWNIEVAKYIVVIARGYSNYNVVHYSPTMIVLHIFGTNVF